MNPQVRALPAVELLQCDSAFGRHWEALRWLAIHFDSGMVVAMDASSEQWKALGAALVRRRVELGFSKRTEFASSLGLTHDRTLSDIENGRRTNYGDATIAQIERFYRIAEGAIQGFFEVGDLRPSHVPLKGGYKPTAFKRPDEETSGLVAVLKVASSVAEDREKWGDGTGFGRSHLRIPSPIPSPNRDPQLSYVVVTLAP